MLQKADCPKFWSHFKHINTEIHVLYEGKCGGHARPNIAQSTMSVNVHNQVCQP